MAGVLRSGRTPHLYTFPSSAASLCQAARRAGIDLSGAQFTVDAEPVTDARLAAIRESGANPVPAYGSVESAFIGYWCLNPEASDDIHLSHDLHAVIQAGEENPSSGLPPPATLFSSVRRTAPLILLNLSLGDQAVLGQRTCGCPLESVGWKTHLRETNCWRDDISGL